MDNPYQSPEEPCSPFGRGSPNNPSLRPRGLVNHVRAVAILMILQGVLDLVMACVLGAMAALMGHLIFHQEMQQHPPNGGPSPEQMFSIFTVMYGVMAVVVLAVAALHIVAGVQNLRFRGRTLGIVALASGVLTFFTFWCLPTALGLAIYGLIVYLNRSVSEAFRMSKAGCSYDKIFNTFQL
jgi:hypothetical protein